VVRNRFEPPGAARDSNDRQLFRRFRSLVLRSGATLLAGGIALAAASVAATAATRPPAGHDQDGPPPGFSGGFGEPSCYACHLSEEPDTGPGRLWIEGFPEAYEPGETYPIRVTFTRPRMAAAGFQLTTRFEESGEQAGRVWIVPGEEALVGVASDRGVDYAHQRAAGATPTQPDTARWILLWTAPDGVGTIRLHVAGVAGDGDGSASGDLVYTLELASFEADP